MKISNSRWQFISLVSCALLITVSGCGLQATEDDGGSSGDTNYEVASEIAMAAVSARLVVV